MSTALGALSARRARRDRGPTVNAIFPVEVISSSGRGRHHQSLAEALVRTNTGRFSFIFVSLLFFGVHLKNDPLRYCTVSMPFSALSMARQRSSVL